MLQAAGGQPTEERPQVPAHLLGEELGQLLRLLLEVLGQGKIGLQPTSQLGEVRDDLLLRVARRRRVLRTPGRDYVKCWPGQLRQACPPSKGSEHNARLTIMLARFGLESNRGDGPVTTPLLDPLEMKSSF